MRSLSVAWVETSRIRVERARGLLRKSAEGTPPTTICRTMVATYEEPVFRDARGNALASKEAGYRSRGALLSRLSASRSTLKCISRKRGHLGLREDSGTQLPRGNN